MFLDEVFQPHKIWRTGLYQEVAGAVIIFRHKLEHLRELAAAYPADHSILVEDKPDILQAAKRTLGAQVATVFVRQGKYAAACAQYSNTPAWFSHSLRYPGIRVARMWWCARSTTLIVSIWT